MALMDSAMRGAATAARANERVAMPLKARWSLLQFPVFSQASSTSALSSPRKIDEEFTKPVRMSVQFWAAFDWMREYVVLKQLLM